MAMRYFNWKLAIVLIVAAVVFIVAVFSLHQWQKSTRAEQGLTLGERAFEQRRWDEAAQQLGHYVAVNPQDTAVLIKYAEAQTHQFPRDIGSINQAIAAYRNVLRFKPDDLETTRRLAELYLPLRRYAEAESTVQRYLQRKDDAVLRCLLGKALWEQRKFAQALVEWKKVIEDHPDEIAAYVAIAAASRERPDETGRKAMDWCNDAVSKNPDSAHAYGLRAEYSLRDGDREHAQADLARAIKCDLSDTQVRFYIIDLLMLTDLWDEAKEQLQALEAASPTEVDLWNRWAAWATRKGGSDEDKQSVAERGMKALEMYPWEFISTATRLLIQAGQLEKAEEYLTLIRAKDFDAITIAYLEGTLANKQGRTRDAIAAWQRAVSFQPPTQREVELQKLAYMDLASAFVQLGDTQSAINQLQILVAQNSDNLLARQRLAALYAQRRDWEKVLEQTAKIKELARDDPNEIRKADLLELQAQSSTAARSETGSEAWSGIETRLTELGQESSDALAVKLLQVQIAMARKDFTEAGSLLDELEGKYPSDVRPMLLRASLYVAQDKKAEAKALYEKAIAQFPQASLPVQGLAVFLNSQDQRAECELLVKEAFVRIQEPRIRRDLGLLLADFYRQWQEKDKLYQWLTDLTTQFPDDIPSRRLLLTCEPVWQDDARAQKIVDEIKALEGEKGSQWRCEQTRLWLLRRDEFRNAASKTPDPAKPRLRDTPLYAQTVTLLQDGLRANPDDQDSRLLLARVYELAREPQLALNVYNDALARDPNNIRIIAPAVSALQREGRFEEAQRILDRLGDKDLNHPLLQRLTVGSDVQRGDLTSASETLQQLVTRDPNDVDLKLTYARVLILRKQFTEAEAILKELKEHQPDSIPVARYYILLFLLQGDAAKGMQVCDQMVQKLHSAEAYVLRAETNLSLRQFDKALEDLGQAVVLEPQNVGTWQARASVYVALGRLDDAIADVRQALAVVPDDPPSRKLQVQKVAIQLFLQSGKASLRQEAEVMVDNLLASQTSSQSKVDADLRLYKAQLLKFRGTGPAIEEARRLMQQVTADDPKNVNGWKLMAQLELDQGEPGRALDYATRGLAYSEQNKDLLYLKAMAEKMLSPSVAALTTLPMLASLDPNNVGILIEWADAHAKAGRPDKAVELLSSKLASFTGESHRRCEIALAAAMYSNQERDKAKTLFEKLIAAEPNDPTPVMTLGQLLRREKRWTEVNQLVNLWRTTNPKDAETATNMARILAGSGDKEALQMAEDQLRMILGPNPNSVPTLVLLGMLMQDAGRIEEATRLNRQILDLDPNNVIAINNLAWMLCEKPSSSPEQVKEAIELANRGVGIKPDYMDLLDTRGLAYFRAGEFEKAAADLNKALSLYPANSPGSAAPQFHLAQTYAAMNRRTQALEHLKIAMGLNWQNIQVAKDHAQVGRKTYAIKVLRDAISLQDQMDQFKTGFDQRDLIGVRAPADWAQARLDFKQLSEGR